MCDSHLDHQLLVREVEARVAAIRVADTAPETNETKAQGPLAWARDALVPILRKARHV